MENFVIPELVINMVRSQMNEWDVSKKPDWLEKSTNKCAWNHIHNYGDHWYTSSGVPEKSHACSKCTNMQRVCVMPTDTVGIIKLLPIKYGSQEEYEPSDVGYWLKGME